MNLDNYRLGQLVTIICSGENGMVIGKAEYLNNENSFLIRYKSADGRAVENWWSCTALQPYRHGDGLAEVRG